jgi:hypothetical protein
MQQNNELPPTYIVGGVYVYTPPNNNDLKYDKEYIKEYRVVDSSYKKINGFEGCKLCDYSGFYCCTYSLDGLCHNCEFKQHPELSETCSRCEGIIFHSSSITRKWTFESDLIGDEKWCIECDMEMNPDNYAYCEYCNIFQGLKTHDNRYKNGNYNANSWICFYKVNYNKDGTPRDFKFCFDISVNCSPTNYHYCNVAEKKGIARKGPTKNF